MPCLTQSMSGDCSARFRYTVKGIALCALLIVAATSGFAQTGTGTITGTVTDPGGLVVPGAAVSVRNTETGIAHPLKTNEAGIYVAPFLQPGQYEVTASKEGFASVKHPLLTLQVGQTLTVDIALPVQGAKETVTVTGEVPLIEVEKTDVSQVISQSITENVPMANRRWNDFALLTPATTADGSSGLVSYRGISGLYNQNSVDGANNNQAFFSEARGRAIGAPFIYSSDSIKEYEVNTSNYNAEYGQAAGGIVNAVTKSGSNALHGDLFYMLRYPTANALDPFSKFSALESHLTPTQPVHQQQEFGGSVGGPIIKDKLFYFVTYDGFRKVFPVSYTSSQQAHYPLPCPVQASATQCTEANGFLSSLLGSFPRTTKNDVFFGKLDYQLSHKNHLSGAFDLANWDSPNSYNTNYVINNNSVTANGTAVTHDRFIIGTWDSTLTASAVNEVRFQWGRDFEVISSNYPAPSVSLSNITAYGQPNALPRPAFPDEHRIQISDTLSLVKGKHNLKFGFDANLVHDLIINLFNGSGIYSYSSTSTSNSYGAACAASNGSYEPFCNWVADIFSLAASGTTGQHYSTFSQVYDPITKVGRGDFMDNLLDWFVQDSWKIRPNLTLNVGLRYDLQLLPAPPIPNTKTPLLTQLTSTMNTDKGEFAPRIGIAWQPFKNTVVRAGYGLFYALTQTSTYYALAYENGVFQTQYNCNPGTACAPTFPNVLFTPPGPPLASPFTGAPIPTVCSSCAAAATLATIATHGLITNFLPPRVHEGNLAIEHQLPGNMTVSASYLFSRGQRLPAFVDANIDPVNGVSTKTYDVLSSAGAVTQTFAEPFYTQRLNPATGVILTGESVLNSWYNALVVTWRKPMSHDLEVFADYTFSKSQDNGQVEGQFGTFYGTDDPVNPFNLKAENALSDLNQTHHFGSSVVWTPSYFKGASSRLERGFLSGWILSTAVGAGSGQPVTPNLVQSSYGGIDGGPTGAVVNNSGTNTGGRAPWLGRNTFTGPGFFDMDARIGRNIPIRERAQLQVRVDAFNLLNHQNVLAVNTSAFNFAAAGSGACPAAAAGFGGCFVPNSSFLAPTSTSGLLLGARQMQFSARLNF